MSIANGTDIYAPNKTIYEPPGTYSVCVTATASDGQGHTAIDTSPMRTVYMFLQPTATLNVPASVYSSTGPFTLTVSAQFGPPGAPFGSQQLRQINSSTV